METKKCPFCGEEIMQTAQKCRYCGEWLQEESPAEQISESIVEQKEDVNYQRGGKIAINNVPNSLSSIVPFLYILAIIGYLVGFVHNLGLDSSTGGTGIVKIFLMLTYYIPEGLGIFINCFAEAGMVLALLLGMKRYPYPLYGVLSTYLMLLLVGFVYFIVLSESDSEFISDLDAAMLFLFVLVCIVNLVVVIVFLVQVSKHYTGKLLHVAWFLLAYSVFDLILSVFPAVLDSEDIIVNLICSMPILGCYISYLKALDDVCS